MSAGVKDCPFCFEVINARAIRCRFCHADLATASPQQLAQASRVSGSERVAPTETETADRSPKVNTPNAAETILREHEVSEVLGTLVEKSLVARDEYTERYRLLETVRQYSRERLLESGEGEAVRERHRDVYLGLSVEAEPQLAGPEQAAWLVRLDTEHDNLRIASEWRNDADALRLAGALWRFWYARCHFNEGRTRLAVALTGADNGSHSFERAKALRGAGGLAYLQGDNVSARTLLEEALDMCREIGDRQGIANALNNLGLLSLSQGDFLSARTLVGGALSVFREIGDRPGTASSLLNLGIVYMEQVDYVLARSALDESLTICREIGNRQGIAHALNTLGIVALTLSDYSSTRTFYAESLAIRREIGETRGIAYSLESFAALFSARGETETASRLWGAAEVLREALVMPLPPNERIHHDRQVDEARMALGDEAFAAAWKEGREMTLEQAIEYALEISD